MPLSTTPLKAFIAPTYYATMPPHMLITMMGWWLVMMLSTKAATAKNCYFDATFYYSVESFHSTYILCHHATSHADHNDGMVAGDDAIY
mmetsp:Transcript_23822/g.41064  ORF Transcript_23822/g.41064 Transcript_23822/m.41064 type:complete len:89 (+) Transcript_23822:3-269(+)